MGYAGDGYYLNAIGLCNPGIRVVLDIHLPLAGTSLRHRNHPLGQTLEEYALLARITAAAGVDYSELNLSCVNADTPALTPSDISSIAARCLRPVYPKIGRRTTAPPPTAYENNAAIAIAHICQLAGVIVGNTVSVPTNGQLDTTNGGLSSARLRSINLALLKAVKPHAGARSSRLPRLPTPPTSPNTGP